LHSLPFLFNDLALRRVSSKSIRSLPLLFSISTYLFTNAGGFTFTNGSLAALPTLTTALSSASTLIASPTSPFLFTQLNNEAAGNEQPDMLTAELVNVDGSLTAAPSPIENVFAAGLAAPGIAPVPTEADLARGMKNQG
jgi:hypothetical protein